MTANLLTKPLSSFHSEFTSIFEEWPKKEKEITFEIARRVIIAVAALFAYPAFGCLYLMGKFYDSFSKSESGAQSTRECINISEKMQDLKKYVLDEFSETMKKKTIEAIQSTKIFININVDGKSLSKDYIIKKKDKSTFDKEFLTKEIEKIIKDLGKLIQKETCKDMDIKWEALIKVTNTTFARTNGAWSSQGTSFWTGSRIPNITLELVQETIKSILEVMDRKIEPQLNANFEFV